MEKFKSLEELTKIDQQHIDFSVVCGSLPTLEGMHKYLSKEILNKKVPDEIKSQFNVAKNMAVYSYYFYALAPEVHLKTYRIIEHALRLRSNSGKKHMLKSLIELAVKERWVTDAGFRHIKDPKADNEWCNSMIKTISSLRNLQAHGSNMLVGDCLHHISSCADFLNQLFPNKKTHNKAFKRDSRKDAVSPLT